MSSAQFTLENFERQLAVLRERVTAGSLPLEMTMRFVNVAIQSPGFINRFALTVPHRISDSLLSFEGLVEVNPTESFRVDDVFKKGFNSVDGFEIADVWHMFERFFDRRKDIPASAGNLLYTYRLRRKALATELIRALGGEATVVTSFSDIYDLFCQMQKLKNDVLLLDWENNVFFLRDDSGYLWIAVIREVNHEGWNLQIDRVDSDETVLQGARIFTRATPAPKS